MFIYFFLDYKLRYILQDGSELSWKTVLNFVYSITVFKYRGNWPGPVTHSSIDGWLFLAVKLCFPLATLSTSVMLPEEQFSGYSPCSNDSLLWISSAEDMAHNYPLFLISEDLWRSVAITITEAVCKYL